jgi:hypothetical protein
MRRVVETEDQDGDVVGAREGTIFDRGPWVTVL